MGTWLQKKATRSNRAEGSHLRTVKIQMESSNSKAGLGEFLDSAVTTAQLVLSAGPDTGDRGQCRTQESRSPCDCLCFDGIKCCGVNGNIRIQDRENDELL